MHETVLKYFTELDPIQIERIRALYPVYSHWNSMINVISRKDMDNFYIHHVLHSMSIAKVISFAQGTTILDVGTGGGFPGIPLAILLPDVKFTLVDSIGKKIKVVEAVSRELQLQNITCFQARVETIRDKFDFVVSRAVTNLPDFIRLVRSNISPRSFNELNNGILYLKGGEFGDELSEVRYETSVFNLSDHFREEYFETKKLVYVKIAG